MTEQLLAAGIEKTIKIVDKKGKVLTELQKIVKDVTVEEFKKMLVNFKAFRTYSGNDLACHLTLSGMKTLESIPSSPEVYSETVSILQTISNLFLI
jgi:hypothetical protein